MTMSDPIADMLTRIRNASVARHPSCDMPFSKMKVSIAEVLRDEGYIESFEDRGEGIHKVAWSVKQANTPVSHLREYLLRLHFIFM